MKDSELEKLIKDIENDKDNLINYTKYDKLREPIVRDINKMQRPDPWPDPPEEKTSED